MKLLRVTTIISSLSTIFVLFCTSPILAQLDSLYQVLAKAKSKEDTTLVNVYQQLSLYYNNRLSNMDSANFYTDKGLDLASKLNYGKGMARGNMIKSNMYNEKGEIGKAFSSIQKAYQLYIKLGIEREAGQALYGLGNIYLSAGDANNATKYFLEATQLLEKDKKNPALSAAYINLAIGLNKLERYKEAMDYHKKAIVICQKNKDLPREIFAMVNAVATLNNQKMYDSAFYYADQAYQKSTKIAFPIGIIRSLIQKMNIALLQNKHQEALVIGNEIVTQAEKYNQKGYLGTAYRKIAIAYDSLKQYDKALENAKKALILTKEFKVTGVNPLQEEGEAFEILAAIYKHQGNYAPALTHYQKAIALKDSASNKEKEFQNNALASLYETQRKEQEIITLNQQTQMQDLEIQQKNTLLLALGGGTLLLALVGFLFYKQKQLKDIQQLADLEQRLLRSRLNPHFWFNALTSVHALLLGEQNTRKTANYLTKIASVMRQSLESTYQDLIPIEEEKSFIESYLIIQQMRVDSKFDFEIHIDNNLEISELIIPSMLLQPFVENAIEHGFKNLQTQGKIDIYFEKTGNFLKIRIEDNGKGLGTVTDEKQSRHRSRALEITQERLALLKKKLKSAGHVSIENRQEQSGVRVSIELPLM